MEISTDDVPHEEDVLREPFKLGAWLRYLSAHAASPLTKRASIYERALRSLPGSYKLWHAYLTELAAAASPLPITDPAHAALNAAFERALATGNMSRMPRVWHMYATALIDQRLLTRARRALDRALRALPVTQHRRVVWPLALRLANLPGCPAETSTRVLRRYYLQFDDRAHAEEFVDFLVSAGRFREAAEQLAAAIDDEGFCSAKGTTKRQLLLDLCDLIAKHPEDVVGMPVEATLCGAVRKFPEEAGVLWTTLAGHYARKGIHDKARDVFEEGITTASTVKDFRLVFESYLNFEHALVAAELDKGAQEESSDAVLQGCWLADNKDDADMNMARLERLLERRPELLNSVQLRQNPHDVQAWHERVKIFHGNPMRQATTYGEAIWSVDPTKATGKPHTLWIAFAKMYEGHGLLDTAREIFRRATQVNFKSVDDLATVWCERAEMELRHHNHEAAIDLIRKATSEPSIEVTTRVAAADARGEPPAAQMKLHRSLKLWCFFADLMETHGTVDSVFSVYEKIHDLGLATPLLVLNHAKLLREHNRFEDAFRVYQRGVTSFKHPHAEPIWAAYLTAFVERYGTSKPERVRDVFEDAVRQAPAPGKKAMFLRYAKFEEDHGLATRAMKVYEDAANAVPSCDKLGVYDVYVARATALFGALKAREVYHRAISGGGLPDEDARAMCVRFADLEIGLGEVHRARALYVYASGFGHPGAQPEFWRRWNEFEVRHGDESTFREMLRLKRTMAMEGGVQGTEIGTLKRPCAGLQVEDGGMLQQECKRIRAAY
ncbi:hypothetical protein HU200_005501 [Digitaria exilis]|uniref:Pre-mRNA-splicing factor SYF1 n=1 Tax=Digitaria exilis TaxID=1010633 RepID=A0A835FQD4_9POAL|nr:hypothetical protein HU200_005501 [Digitaria exilis]